VPISGYPAFLSALSSERAIDAEDARTDPRTREPTTDFLEPYGITRRCSLRSESTGRSSVL
jgi:hypothetical protein